jgi:hypothetical protein
MYLQEVGVSAALLQAGFDHQKFEDRGGIFEWTRERPNKEITTSFEFGSQKKESA